jgi:hypothetical protein
VTQKARTREVYTAGDPQGALVRALASMTERGQVYVTAIGHDPGCPSSDEGRSMSSCTCEIVHVAVMEGETAE